MLDGGTAIPQTPLPSRRRRRKEPNKTTRALAAFPHRIASYRATCTNTPHGKSWRRASRLFQRQSESRAVHLRHRSPYGEWQLASKDAKLMQRPVRGMRMARPVNRLTAREVQALSKDRSPRAVPDLRTPRRRGDFANRSALQRAAEEGSSLARARSGVPKLRPLRPR